MRSKESTSNMELRSSFKANRVHAEFKGSVKRLTKEMKIKTILSRPHHPQSQGKVERSHRSLRAKMEFDLLKMSQKGVNWVKHLPTYQSKEVL